MRYALPSQLGSSAFFAAPLRAAAARMECELLAAQHAWMQGSACAYEGRKRASLNFGCLLGMPSVLHAASSRFIFCSARARGGCGIDRNYRRNSQLTYDSSRYRNRRRATLANSEAKQNCCCLSAINNILPREGRGNAEY